MAKLSAKTPVIKEKRLKMFAYGPAGVGKTIAALQFPNSYIIDAERGTDFYTDLIVEKGSVILQTNNFDDILIEVKSLLTTKHQYKTLIIDPVTQLYNALQEKWTRVFEKYAKTEEQKEVGDFGMRYWGKVKGDYKALQRMFLQLDMNIIITSHQKDVYGLNFTKIGITYDSMKGEDYFYDLLFKLSLKGTDRMAETIKERALPGKHKFPPEFVWSYENFLKFYGKEIIERAAVPVNLATTDQVKLLEQLLETVKIEEAEIEKWKNKCDVAEWSEMTQEQIQKCLDYIQSKLTLVGGK